jgi:uncharacterized RDD family membrane protein YckC
MTARRFAATAVDFSLAAAWGGLLLLAVWVLVDPPSSPAPAAGQLVGFVSLTVPVTLALAFLDTRGGSPGKRLVGLDLRGRSGGRPSHGQAIVRTTGKVGLPWELAHTAIWRIDDGVIDSSTAALIVAAYLLPVCAAIAVLNGRATWYDLVARTSVRELDRVGTP